VLLGSGAACYWDLGFASGGVQYLMSPLYRSINDNNGRPEYGYALSLCREDIMRNTNGIIQGFIYDQEYSTLDINQIPQLIDDCILFCETNLSLAGAQNYPSIFSANSTIISVAKINSNIKYKANDRITLDVLKVIYNKQCGNNCKCHNSSLC